MNKTVAVYRADGGSLNGDEASYEAQTELPRRCTARKKADLDQFRPILNKAAAHGLKAHPELYSNALKAARRYQRRQTRCQGACQLHFALRTPLPGETGRASAAVHQCLMCRRFISKKYRRTHDQPGCTRRSYRFAKDKWGQYFCYLGCRLPDNPTRLDLLSHLTYEHRKQTDLLNAVGLRWTMLAQQCWIEDNKVRAKAERTLNARFRDRKLTRKLADMARGGYLGMRESEAEIDQLGSQEARDRCKVLLRANRLLLRERDELPVFKRSRSTNTSPGRVGLDR